MVRGWRSPEPPIPTYIHGTTSVMFTVWKHLDTQVYVVLLALRFLSGNTSTYTYVAGLIARASLVASLTDADAVDGVTLAVLRTRASPVAALTERAGVTVVCACQSFPPCKMIGCWLSYKIAGYWYEVSRLLTNQLIKKRPQTRRKSLTPKQYTVLITRHNGYQPFTQQQPCLLYTSDAADDC